jgi:hypothetical protein
MTIDPRAAQRIQPELMSDEKIYWAGTPNPDVIFHSDDWAAVPFSLIWTSFFVFWEADALGMWRKTSRPGGSDLFTVLWGIPFLIVGNYLVWVRFLVDAWLKRRTYYAITNLRVLVLRDGRRKKTSTAFLEAIPTIEKEGTVTGTLWFGPKYPLFGSRRVEKRSMSRFGIGNVPVFADIEDVESVYRLVMDLREKRSSGSNSKKALAYEGS